MADLSDVEDALVAQASLALYPDGIDQPGLADATYRIYRGWPSPGALNADLAANMVNVTVFPSTLPGETTTRWPPDWRSTPTQPTLLAATTGTMVTFQGSADEGQVAGLLVDGKAYAYRVMKGDTPALVAANMALQIGADRIALASGASISFPGAATVQVRILADTTARQATRRQKRDLLIICWTPTPELRDLAATAIDSQLSKILFLDLGDLGSVRLNYCGTQVYDQSQNALLYRRDLIYSAEYPTTVVTRLPTMVFGKFGLNSAAFTA